MPSKYVSPFDVEKLVEKKKRDVKFIPLVPDSRLIEIARGFIANRSDDLTRPDMNDERNLLKLLQVIVDEAAARIPLWELEKGKS